MVEAFGVRGRLQRPQAGPVWLSLGAERHRGGYAETMALFVRWPGFVEKLMFHCKGKGVSVFDVASQYMSGCN